MFTIHGENKQCNCLREAMNEKRDDGYNKETTEAAFSIKEQDIYK